MALAVGALLVPVAADAEIILDDFDEAFEIILPEGANRPHIVQQGVGPLGAKRWSGIVAITSRPTGRVDAELLRPSFLNIEIDRLNPTIEGSLANIGLNLLYEFDEIDVTQGGINDRVAIDFAFLRSAVPLSQIRVSLRDLNEPEIFPRGIGLYDIPVNDQPFTIEFPLVAFYRLGAVRREIDFQRVIGLSLHISPNRFIDLDAINLSAAVERIRFTHAVPEPEWGALACVCVFSVTCRMTRRPFCDMESVNGVTSRQSAFRQTAPC